MRMKFILDQHIIDQRDILEWARSILSADDTSWKTNVARTIQSYYGPSDFIELTTSGSTGIPKKIRINKQAMRLSAEKTGTHFGLQPGMMSYNCLPSQYIAGKMMIIRALVLELDQILVQPKIELELSYQGQIDFAAMIPMQAQYVLENKPDFLSNIGCLILGGSPVSSDLRKRLSHIHTRCYLTYGMTETITHVAAARLDESKESLLFEALEGVRLETIDQKLVIYADHLEEKKITTTDVVDLLDEKHFRWLGRADNVINSGGVKVHPELLEEKLSRIVSEPFFIGSLKDDRTGEKVILLIEGQPFSSRRKEALSAELKRLPPGEQPREIHFIPKFERTATGKIKRNPNIYLSGST